MHDPLCTAYLVDPSVIRIHKYWVGVETHGDLTIGRSVIDMHHCNQEEPNVWMALNANEAKFVRILLETFARRSPDPTP